MVTARDQLGRPVRVWPANAEHEVCVAYDARGGIAASWTAGGERTLSWSGALPGSGSVSAERVELWTSLPCGDEGYAGTPVSTDESVTTVLTGGSASVVWWGMGDVPAEQHVWFDPAGRVTTAIAADGGVTLHDYDDAGRLFSTTSQTTSQQTDETQFVYDADGYALATTLPDARRAVSLFDSLGRARWQQVPGHVGTQVTSIFDAAGRNWTTVAQTTGGTGLPATRTTSINADFEAGTRQIASVAWFDAAAAGELVTVEVLERHPNGAPRTIMRSAGGHSVELTSEIDGLGSPFASDVFVEPAAGVTLNSALRTLSTQEGNVVRHTSTTVDDGAFAWQAFGAPDRDALGRVRAWQSDGLGVTLQHVATIAAHEAVTVPDGFGPVVRSAQIDPYGMRVRLVQVAVGGVPVAQEARVVDTLGRVALQAIGTAAPDGASPPDLIVRAPSYDLAGRLASAAEVETGNPAVLSEVDPMLAIRAGNNLEHVVADESGAVARAFGRDTLGALEVETTDDVTTWTATRPTDRETPVSVNGAPLTWDAWGRLLAWDRLVDLEWDAAGELFSVGIDDDNDGDADGSETYIRDPAGRALLILREWPDGHTERVQQIFDGLNLIEERTADGWRRRHLGGTGALDSSRAYTLDCSLAASMGGDCDDPPRSFGASAVFLTDEEPTATFVLARSLNGDVIAVIDPTDGTVVESYAYGLHGELTIRSRGASDCDAEADAECYGRFGNAFFYTGAPRSPLTGLYDRRARQYSAALRMWISPDPATEHACRRQASAGRQWRFATASRGFVDGWDRWMYVGGDPVNFVDPLGWGRTDGLGAGGGAGRFDPNLLPPDPNALSIWDALRNPQVLSDVEAMYYDSVSDGVEYSALIVRSRLTAEYRLTDVRRGLPNESDSHLYAYAGDSIALCSTCTADWVVVGHVHTHPADQDPVPSERDAQIVRAVDGRPELTAAAN